VSIRKSSRTPTQADAQRRAAVGQPHRQHEFSRFGALRIDGVHLRIEKAHPPRAVVDLDHVVAQEVAADQAEFEGRRVHRVAPARVDAEEQRTSEQRLAAVVVVARAAYVGAQRGDITVCAAPVSSSMGNGRSLGFGDSSRRMCPS
jgi:protein required for attachment to host cells